MTAIKSEGSFRPAPVTPDETEKVQQILDIMCGACDKDNALIFLRRHNGDVEKTISALLDNAYDTAPTTSGTQDYNYSELRAAAAGVVTPHTPAASVTNNKSPVIDLTAEDEDGDLSRALKASLEDQSTTFGPSDRAPDPNWAVVPSDVPVGGPSVSRDDQEMSQAIEESLKCEMMDTSLERTLADRLRQGDTPVSLLPSSTSYTYAAMVIHGLFFVPQIREYIAHYRPHTDTLDEHDQMQIHSTGLVSPPRRGHPHMVWTLLETFVNMELSRMNELDADAALKAFNAAPLVSIDISPVDITNDFYNNLVWAVESVLHGHLATATPQSETWPRLFHLRHGNKGEPPFLGPFNKEYDTATVQVEVKDTEDSNDLVSCLTSELIDDANGCEPRQVIIEPSEVIAFQLKRASSTSLKTRHIFSYPPTVYLDQFMAQNTVISSEKRRQRKAALAEGDISLERRSTLLNYKNRDTIADLQSAIHYFENVADDKGDKATRGQLQETADKLKSIVERIQSEVKRIDVEIEECKVRAAQALECPELQVHKYDLRVVLVHDGFYGRSHLYSYVKQKGQWWKTLDHTASQVAEDEVLNDPIGRHLGAGPYFLIYSRATTIEEETAPLPYPTYLKNTVKENNKTFFEQLPLDIVADVVDPNSPPTSPYATPLEDLEQSVTLSSVELMDVDAKLER